MQEDRLVLAAVLVAGVALPVAEQHRPAIHGRAVPDEARAPVVLPSPERDPVRDLDRRVAALLAPHPHPRPYANCRYLHQVTSVALPPNEAESALLLNTLLDAVAMFVMFTIHIDKQQLVPRVKRRVVDDLTDGVRYILRSRIFYTLIGLTYATHFFGFQYVQLMPLFAKRFDVGADGEVGLGFLYSIMGVGAITGTAVASRLRGQRRLGRFMIGGSLLFTVFVSVFAFSPYFVLSLAAIFFAAMSNTVFFVSSMTTLQLRVPSNLRGRVMGIYTVTFSLIPLGGFMGGAIADSLDERWAVFIGAALLAAVVGIVALFVRELRSIDGTKLESESPA